MGISLKFLHFFKFIKWSPVGWSKKHHILIGTHWSVKWVFLIVVLIILFAIFYLIVSFLEAIPPGILAVVLSVIVVIMAEWLIGGEKTFTEIVKSVSIPLLSITAIVFRFLAGTAVFMRKMTKNE